VAVALIVAAGRGERLGSPEPKALLAVGGRPMLEWSVIALRGVERVEEIVIALPVERLEAAPAGTTAVAGGTTRSESVLAALDALAHTRSHVDDEEAVIVHDAARVFAGPQLFNAALDELERSDADAVVTAAPVTDTIKQTRGHADEPDADLTVTATIDRSTLWAVQTPQVFRLGALRRALHSDPRLIAQATDDAWLIEQIGGRVVVLPATAANFKITTPLDLQTAETILGTQQ
jgi:2-C-methyl-D-erythritol 4-phosphate cytidylyltransferase